MTKINYLSGDLIKFMEKYNYYAQTLLNQLKLIIIIINIILKYNFIHPIVKNWLKENGRGKIKNFFK